jgi:PLP dependent protein
MSISQNVRSVLAELPPGVELVAAVKTRAPEEIFEAINAGIRIVGENYVQEAEAHRTAVGSKVLWHLIGSLQKNKVKKAVKLFDLVETADSLELVDAVDRECAAQGKVMPLLIEVNSGREPQKSGVLPEDVAELARAISDFGNVRLMGLMTMGPRFGDPQDARPCFAETRRLFEQLKLLNIPGAEMKYLSMGMTNSYRVAIEEGANIIRLGSRLFSERS